MTRQPPEPIDWSVARRVAAQALRLAPLLDDETRRRFDDEIEDAAAQAEALVEQATGLKSLAGPPNVVVVDRLGWVDVNISSFQRLLRPLTERLAERQRRMPARASTAGSAISGAEVGLILAWLSSRVLGQYDLFGDGEGGDAVYFVRAERREHRATECLSPPRVPTLDRDPRTHAPGAVHGGAVDASVLLGPDRAWHRAHAP